jgi:hypothetical protein
VTFGLGLEYFTRFKVYQFGYEGVVNPGRWVAAKIGFQASWWVGFFAGWFLGRVAIPRVALGRAVRLSFVGVGLMLGVTLVFGFGGWVWAQWRLDDPSLGIHIHPKVWAAQYKYSNNAVVAVFASHEYDASDYIRNYDEFLSIANNDDKK